MSLGVILSIALSSLSWSLFDMSRKKLVSSLSPASIAAWLMLLQTPLFAMLAMGEEWQVPHVVYFAPALGSIVLNCVANVWFIESVRLAPLSLAIPVLSLTPVFSAIGGFLLLGEMTSLRQSLGIAIIVASTFAIAAGGGGHSSSDPRAVRRGVLLMVGVALLWAVTPVLDKICLKSAPASEHAFLQCLSVAAILFAWVRFKSGEVSLAQLKGNRFWLLFAVFFAATALFSQLWSIQHVPVGIFEALKRSYGLLSALALGYLMFREPITLRKAVLVVTMGFGIVILLV